ncbi:hypothetical protein MCOR27_004267 [Pyricularia oryzae]|uniref:Uncharacterized protein n=1 Tax=Pyricularia grisea TaxID=148305 RepID=A0ABQ8N4Z3_PYRGI|nr:hypothetical protein MCOR01_005306 [Pyricularia oryzae]KAI6291388.1 hypothetical protein MCOR33_010659 [Pyricularia grisea]KAI6252420.1 hypothetical protein MCOR19_010968 [Pyricularia oryzae]KAI6271747.1 hypothetical protein MCOR26_007663 [Pyricularia oryzae]KAI6281240.1 hypothetical protein MCOR27_004267 [Pyricularia oryzae]
MDLLFEITVDLICSNEALSKRDATYLHEAVEESAVTPLPKVGSPSEATPFQTASTRPGQQAESESRECKPMPRFSLEPETFVAQTPLGSEASVSPKQALTSNLFLSVEFLRTVKGQIHCPYIGCVHPVHWLSWSEKSEVAIVIIRFIPEEVQLHMSIVRKHGTPSYILTYAAPATRKRLHFNNFNYYSIPELPHNRVAPLWAEDWLALRRGGQDFIHSPMGHITRSKSLQAEHPFLRNGDLKSHNKANRPLAPISWETKPNMDEDSGDGFDRMEHLMEGRASNYMVSSSESESEVK